MATLALIRDLMFASKVTATARALGVDVTIVRDPAQLVAGDRLIVDLNQPGALDAAVAWKTAEAGRQVIGFVSHVDTETTATARAAGIDKVLARSAFVNQLPELLRHA